MAHKSLYRFTIGLNTAYVLVVALFFIDAYSMVEIKWQPLKTMVYLGIVFGAVLLLFINLFALKSKLFIVPPLAMLIFCLVVNPLYIIFSSGAWHTQDVLYQNVNNSATIEYQIQDVGARGYNTRTVQVRYLTPLFTINSLVPSNYKQSAHWQPVFKEINQLGLKY